MYDESVNEGKCTFLKALIRQTGAGAGSLGYVVSTKCLCD